MFEYFFSFRGRVTRRHYWMTVLAYLAAFGVAIGIGFALIEAGLSTVPAFIVPGILFLITIVSGISVAVRRLHDRNKSWWWLFPFYFIPTALDPELFSSDSIQFALAAMISAGLSIWGLIELGFLRGDRGPNKYGEDPLGMGESPEVFT